jgi:type II secretory pathway pseudopilin PulG
VLAELLVAVAILAIVATLALGAWARSQEAGALRQAEMQTAAILRDAISRTQVSDPAASGGLQAQVIFTPGGGTVVEQVQTNGGAWQNVAPAGASSTLPAGVTVQSTTWTSNAMQVLAGDTSTGTYEAYHTTVAGSVTLTTAHGMTGVVHVTGAGTVWY